MQPAESVAVRTSESVPLAPTDRPWPCPAVRPVPRTPEPAVVDRKTGPSAVLGVDRILPSAGRPTGPAGPPPWVAGRRLLQPAARRLSSEAGRRSAVPSRCRRPMPVEPTATGPEPGRVGVEVVGRTPPLPAAAAGRNLDNTVNTASSSRVPTLADKKSTTFPVPS